MSLFSYLGRSALFMLEPERAHAMAIQGLKSGLIGAEQIADKRLAVDVAGLKLPNPLGVAAGFDKNAQVPDAILRLGFGMAEIGTVTPRPQAGNSKPRLFRLIEDEAVINRMGFNNEGHKAVLSRLQARKRQGIVGVNIGANKDSEDRISDYVAGIGCFYDVTDYFTVNISSPNTPGLRDLQARESLRMLMDAVSAERKRCAAHKQVKVPIFLKIAPDLDEESLDDIAAELQASDFDGVIVSNTTLSRHGLKDQKAAKEAGGLSGKPLFEPSTIVLAKMRERLGEMLPIIGVGGVDNAHTFIEKIKAGADLVQLYSAMVFVGPHLPAEILKNTLQIMKRDGVDHISAYRGQTQKAWANLKLTQ